MEEFWSTLPFRTAVTKRHLWVFKHELLRFKSCHNMSIEIRSGHWLKHSKTSNLLFFSHFHVDLIVCFGTLSCCVTQLRFSFSSQTDGLTFSYRILWYRAEFMLPSIKASRPGPETAKHPKPSHYHHHADSWCEVLTVECSVWFLSDMNYKNIIPLWHYGVLYVGQWQNVSI